MYINFKVHCVGCEKEFPLKCRKPGLLTPSRENVKCPNCESSMIFRIDKGRDREKPGLIAVTPLKFTPSSLFLDALAMAEEEAKEAKENETPITNTDVASPVPSEGQREETTV